nr:hypothetical protein [Parachlamydiaceae bacterium]
MWNKLFALTVLVIITSLLISPFEVEARGEGRGGGRNSVGSSNSRGGGQTINRTPTMSRASIRPAEDQTRTQTQTRPSNSQDRIQQSPQIPQQRPLGANRAEIN